MEVENFRQLMLRLVVTQCDDKSWPTSSRDNQQSGYESTTSRHLPCCVIIETPSPTPPKIFPSPSDLEIIQKCTVTNVERKGKLIRLVLKRLPTVLEEPASDQKDEEKEEEKLYLYFHMGMTGRISCPDNIPSLESLPTSESFPPPHTHLILSVKQMNSSTNSNSHNDNIQDNQSSCVAFSDPRRFGAVSLGEPLSLQWEKLAQDALMHDKNYFIQQIIGQKKGIKSLLLDQRAVVSGVGNWIADEILYQCEIHPDQRFLTVDEATALSMCLNKVLKTGIECLSLHQEYPTEWLFHHRWNKGKGGVQKDFKGKTIAYVQSGGRTSAIVPALQKMKASRKVPNKDTVTEKHPIKRKTTSKSRKGKEQGTKQKNRLEEDDQIYNIRRSKRIARQENK